jgi:phosphoribosylamine-glycine ligase
MKYIFLTYDGHGLPVAYKLLLEGNDVIVGQAKKLEHIPKEEEELMKRRLSLYDGMIEKIDADELIEKMRKENPEDWFVICDFNYVYPYAEKLKKMGFRGLLPTREDFEFEEDRNKAKEYVFRKYDIFSQQDIQEFDSIKEALNFLKKSEKIYGIKGFNPEAPTYFPMSNDKQVAYDELEDIMISNQKLYESEGFILEEKIEDLIEFIPEIIIIFFRNCGNEYQFGK